MPRMKAISTTRRIAATTRKSAPATATPAASSPIETPPVIATINPAQRNVPGAAGDFRRGRDRRGFRRHHRFWQPAAPVQQYRAGTDDHVGRRRDLDGGDHAVFLHQPEPGQRRARHRAQAVHRVKPRRTPPGIGRKIDAATRPAGAGCRPSKSSAPAAVPRSKRLSTPAASRRVSTIGRARRR